LRGGIYVPADATPRIEACVIVGNDCTGNFGGGIGCENGGKPVIVRCTIEGNSARFGGGVFGGGGSISDSEIRSNSAESGGGLASCTGPIREARIESNRARSNGGGAAFCADIADSVIRGNSADGRGGGIYHEDTPAVYRRCVIERNRAGDIGGGAFLEDASALDAEYFYDPAHRLQRIDYANGTYELRTYDDADRLLTITHKDATGTTRFQLSYV
jgi:YD repeat-containing protein